MCLGYPNWTSHKAPPWGDKRSTHRVMSRMEKERSQRMEDRGAEDLGTEVRQIECTRNVIRLYYTYVANGVLEKDKPNQPAYQEYTTRVQGRSIQSDLELR